MINTILILPLASNDTYLFNENQAKKIHCSQLMILYGGGGK